MIIKTIRTGVLALTAALSIQVWAAEPPATAGQADAEEATAGVPAPPPRLQSGEALEPEVTIIQQRDRTLHEYRVNGVLYMVKVVPVDGAPYYFLDTDGDGDLDARRDDPHNISVPQWVLFRW